MRSLYCAYGVKNRMPIKWKTSKTLGPVVLWLCLLAVLLALPTGYESALSYQNADRVDALVLSTDESDIVDTGLVRSGAVCGFWQGSLRGQRVPPSTG